MSNVLVGAGFGSASPPGIRSLGDLFGFLGRLTVSTLFSFMCLTSFLDSGDSSPACCEERPSVLFFGNHLRTEAFPVMALFLRFFGWKSAFFSLWDFDVLYSFGNSDNSSSSGIAQTFVVFDDELSTAGRL